MSFRYKIIIEYDGTSFYGWQQQDGVPTVQQHLQEAILALSKKPIVMYGSGRTDAGVHALGQVAHFNLDRDIEPFRVQECMNAYLREVPIVVLSAERVSNDFDARFSTKERAYIYKILNRRARPALLQNRCWHMMLHLDEQSMNDFSKNLRQKLKAQLEMNMKVSVDSGTGTAKLTVQALGGSYYGGSWHDIPQYAKGGKPNYGSMFIAGEAGPEIVGHLNGRTEVLNKSQIAATIHSAFVSSMAQFGNRMLATPESVAIQSGSYSAYNASANGDGQTAMLAEQNRLLAEQNQLLREIAEKDVSISSRDVFNAVKSESNRYNNRTGGSPFLF